MLLPQLEEPKKSREYQTRFGGICRLETVPDGSMSDTEGVSLAQYPVASTRPGWAYGYTFSDFNGMYAKEGLLWVDGTALYYKGAAQPVLLTNSEKQMVGMGSGVYIFPDKVRFDVVTHEVQYLENMVTKTGATVNLCDYDGNAYQGYIVSGTAPEDPENGTLWLDTSVDGGSLKQWSEASAMWVPIVSTYVRVSATGIGAGFRAGDCVTVTGFTDPALNGSFELTNVGADFVVHIGLTVAEVTESGSVAISRTVPDMDYVCELNNRLWGCSTEKHEIYACALGDATNWNRFQGLSTDSYALTVGSDGGFTGAVGYLGSVIFFKEQEILKIYGTKPANYQLQSVKGRGVEDGSAGSIATVNEVLYYKSPEGIMRYDAGGMPTLCGLYLGKEWYGTAYGCASSDGRYMLSWWRDDGSPEVLSYDPATSIWVREKGALVKGLTRFSQCVYGVSGNRLVSLTGDTDGTEAYVSGWDAEHDRVNYFVTGDFGLDSPDRKHITKLQLRVKLETNAHMRVWVMYDSDGDWQHKGSIDGTRVKRSFVLPILPRRCDHMKIKVEWTGDAVVYSLARTVEIGTEV